MIQIKSSDINHHREQWTEIATKGGWEHPNKQFVQFFIDSSTGQIKDSVSFRGMTKNYFVDYNTEEDIESQIEIT